MFVEDSLDTCNNEQCVNNYLKDEGFELIECETGEEKIFYEFLEYLDSCVNSVGVTCICKKNKPEKGFFKIEQEDNIIKVNDKGFEIHL